MQADFLIVGSGIAALRAAAALGGAGSVIVLTKSDPLAGNTGYAQGGIAAAVSADDSPELHFADTVAAGDGLCDEAAVRVLVEEGPRYVRELVDWGAQFDRAPDGSLALGLEAAHSRRRVLHARDATGREIGRALWERVAPMTNVRVRDHARVVSLIVENGRCAGARFVDGGDEVAVRAEMTLLATGGAGHVFSETTNPPVATGDGIAMAWRAGAAVADMEFVQFHPTALKVAGQPRFLLSEALRGEGARLINADGEPFMTRYDAAGDLAPRDRVARGIVREAQRTGADVYLSLDRLDPAFVHRRFPLISQACRRAGLDLATNRIPIGPAAHYLMGGVVTDVDARTTLPGLFAAGEVACTGVHGANRLASNSLLEGLVFGARAGAAMRKREDGAAADFRLKAEATRSESAVSGFSPKIGGGQRSESVASGSSRKIGDGQRSESVASGFSRKGEGQRTRELMWQHAGLFRSADGLSRLLHDLGHPEPGEDTCVTVGRLIARAALRREESRGAHFRIDFPDRDDQRWKHRVSDLRASDSE